MTERCDIAIVGGGMVGAALALTLAQGQSQNAQPLSIRVFEAFALPQQAEAPLQPSFDARSTALSLGTRHIFERLGVWDALAETCAPIDKIRVSDRGHFGSVRLDAATQRVPALGYVIENRVLGQVLLQQLQQTDNARVVTFSCPAEVVAAKAQGDGYRLEYESEGQSRCCDAELLVIADGGRSGLCEQLQIDRLESPYQQCAVIANVRLDRPHQGVAFERFTAQGPMALLPLTDDEQQQPRAALVWSVPLEQADELLKCDESTFVNRLQRQFGYRAGRILAVGQRHSYPLKLTQAREQVRRGVAVLGNAAHTLHPIAGQGFNLALRGAMVLAQELLGAQCDGRPLGGLDTLQTVVDQLQWDQIKTIGFSDRVTDLFSNDQTPQVVARNAGLVAMELLSPLKQLFADSAMGLDMPLPQLNPGPNGVNRI